MAGANDKTVFIDGQAGTTGLQIRDRLAHVDGLHVASIDPSARKDADARLEMMRDCDLVVLCLPDDAAREAVALADELGPDAPKIIDASTAHRTLTDWVYGFPELTPGHADKIANAQHVANPGCYPTAAIALLRPLIDNAVLGPDHPVTINAVSGFSGGGRTMIESYDSGTADPFLLYGLGLTHKHVPELLKYSGLKRRPIFVPSVGNFRQGMLVSIPLHLGELSGNPSPSDLEAVLATYYCDCENINVVPNSKVQTTSGQLAPEGANGTDTLELYVFGNDELAQAVLVARLDNLGKGAAGAAVQNIKLMLDLS